MENIDKKKLVILIGVIFVIIVLISALIYSARKKTATGTETVTNTNPFGISVGNETNNTGNVATSTQETGTTVETGGAIDNSQNYNPLIQLSRERSSGVGFAIVNETKSIEEKTTNILEGTTSTAKKDIVIPVVKARYVERLSGHVYQYDTNTQETTKISNTTIPRTEESIFVENGSKVIMRYLDQDGRKIQSYLGTLPTGNITDKLTGGYLPENIISLTKSPDSKELFYLTKNNSGVNGNILEIATLKEKRIFTNPFTEWLTYWGDKGITLHTKASSGFPGSSYLLSTTGTFSKITSNLLTLTAKNSNTSGIIPISYDSTNMYNKLALYDTNTQKLIDTNVYTVSEKCVWWRDGLFLLCAAPRTPQLSSTFIDDWYKGYMYTADDLYIINAQSGEGIMFADINELTKKETNLDITQMEVSSDGEYLMFIDKKTGNPWLLNLNKVADTISE